MPELPELQAHAERLDAAYRGAALSGFLPLSFTALKTVTPPPEAAVGTPVTGVERRGKHLLLAFAGAGEPVTFVVHLMQGGRLRVDEKRSKRPRGGVARWRFGDRPDLLLTEAGTERRAGVWVVAGDPQGQDPLADLGPEADRVDAAALPAMLAGASMRLHTFLRDQRILAGLGRRLANEVCHRARLSPFAPTRSLDGDAVARLAEAIRAVVEEGVAAERQRADMSASAERPGAVHGRTAQPCPVCGEAVREVAYRSYTVHYCPACQTDGRVLADNTTSKFLK